MVSLTTCNLILHCRTKRRKVKIVYLTTCNFILHEKGVEFQNEKGEDGLSNNMQFHLTLHCLSTKISYYIEKGKDGLSNNMQFHLT